MAYALGFFISGTDFFILFCNTMELVCLNKFEFFLKL